MTGSAVIVWSMLLAAAPAAQHQTHPAEEKKPAVASPAKAAPQHEAKAEPRTAVKPEPKAEPKPEPKAATKPEPKAGTKSEPATAAAEKPAAPPRVASSESAAERILRRLDTEFPYKKTVESSALRGKTSGTPATPRASNRVQLSWRLSLKWPDEIAPKKAPAGPVKLIWR